MIRRVFSTCEKLDKIWAISGDGIVKCESLTKQSLDGAIQVMRESLFKTEPLSIAFGLLEEPGAGEELLQTCYDAARDGISIVAIDTSTNKIIGVLFNKIQVPAPKGESYYEKMKRKSKHRSVIAGYDFFIDIETKVDIFKQYNTNCLMESMYIATLPGYKQKNIAGLLVLSLLKMGRHLYNGENVKTPIDNEELTNADAIPTAIFALATSNYSQKINDKFGYDSILEVKYEDYGKTFSERIGDVHKTCRVFVKRLDSL